jgi:hypothetical protein
MAKQNAAQRKQTKALTKSQLFGSKQKRLEAIEIEELGGTVYLAPLKASEILPFMGADDDSVEAMNARQNELIVIALVDENGKRIFADEDAEQMNELDWDVYTRIVRHLTGKIRGEQKDADAPLQDGESSPSS